MSDRNMEQMNKERCLTEGQGKKFDDKARKPPPSLQKKTLQVQIWEQSARAADEGAGVAVRRRTLGARQDHAQTRSGRAPGKRGTATSAAASRFPAFFQRISVGEAAQGRVRARRC